MKKLAMTVIAVSALMFAQVSARAAVTLNFEGLQNLEQILDFYNGGLGGAGSGPGPNYGVSFGAEWMAIKSASSGGSGAFQNNPSGSTVAFFLTSSTASMIVTGGFQGELSFYYSAPVSPGHVIIYDGTNGTGNQLASLDLAVTPTLNPTNGLPFDNWAQTNIVFNGTAKSVVFSGTANQIGFDDITLGIPVELSLDSLKWLPGGAFVFRVSGYAPAGFSLQSSTNLTAWSSFSTNSLSGGQFWYTNYGAGAVPMLFFRAVTPPK
jgi:hypothetical protein